MRSPMDDPVFDPWHLSDDVLPEPTPRPRRWRSAGDGIKRDLPARPVPRPIEAAAEPIWFIDEPEPEMHPAPDPLVSARPAPATTSPRAERPDPLESVDSTFAERVLPKAVAFVGRLRAERHTASVRDDSFQATPTVEIRFEPWRGPFDTPSAVGGTLELTLGDGEASVVSGTITLDSTASEASADPDDTRQVPLTELTDTWLESLFLELVAHTLRGT